MASRADPEGEEERWLASAEEAPSRLNMLIGSGLSLCKEGIMLMPENEKSTTNRFER